jgi:hypothetical protein
MHARITRVDARADAHDKLNTYFKDSVAPAYAKLPGYKGGLTCADRITGKWQSITFWDSDDALHASDQVALKLRQTATTSFELGTFTVEVYEVGVDLRGTTRDQPPAAKPARGAEASRQ